MKCNHCGQTLPEDSEFCQYCGQKLQIQEADNPDLVLCDAPKSSREVTMNSNITTQGKTSQVIDQGTCLTQAADLRHSFQLQKAAQALIPSLLIPIVAIISCLNIKSIHSKTELFYFSAIILCVFSGTVFLFNRRFQSIAHILTSLSGLFSVSAAVPLLLDPWKDVEENAVVGVFLIVAIIVIIAIAIVQLIFAVILNLTKYYGSPGYKMRCFRKLERMYTLKEKGIISDKEFASLKQQLTNRIS